MTTRATLHELIENLPDDLLSDAENSLGRLAAERERMKAIRRLHEELPMEDEDLSSEEIEALRRLDAGTSGPTRWLTESQLERILSGGGRG